MTSSQLIADPVVRAMVPMAAGAALAVPVAFLASRWFPIGFIRPIEVDPGFRFEAPVLLLGPIVITALTMLWVTVGIRASHRGAPPRGRPAPVESIATRLQPLQAAMSVRFAFTRRSRDSGSPAVALLGVGVVAATAVAAIILGSTVGRLVDHPERYDDPELQIGQGGGAIPTDVIDALAARTDLDQVTLLGAGLVRVGSKSINVSGVRNVVGTQSTIVLAGRLPASDDECALGRVTARQIDVSVGDRIRVTGPAGERDVRVTGIVVVPAAEGGDGIGEGLLTTEAGLLRLDPAAEMTSASLYVADGKDPAEVAESISEEIGLEIGRPDPPPVITSMGRIRSMPTVIALALAALVVVVLSHQLLVAARHRRYDLGVLRALGADRRWAASVVHWQATLTALAIAAVATPLGLVVGRLVARAFLDRVGTPNDASVPAVAITIGIGALILLAHLVAIVPSRRVRRQQIGVDLTER